MDALTFVAELVKALAWPAAAVALALVFRAQLRALLERLNKGRLGPAEFEFERAVQALAARSARQGGASAALRAPAVPARDSILAAWRDLAQAAPSDLQQLPASDRALYQQLGALHAQAQRARDFQPTPEAVRTYVQLACGLQARIKRTR